MRYYEFIMEYKTQITKGNYGQKILDKIGLPTIVQRKAFPPNMYENDYTMGALDLMDTPRINPIDNSHNIDNITVEDYNEHKDEIVDWLLQQFEYFDPTPNKQYTQQIVKWFLNAKSLSPQGGFPSIEDGISTLKQSLYSFQKMKERLPQEMTRTVDDKDQPYNPRDIASYPDAGTFMSSVQKMRQEFGKPDDLPKGDSIIIYNKDGVTARWAKDQAAACHLGQGTQWCTAATQSNNMFNYYNDRGALIVIQLAEPIRFSGEPDEEQYDPQSESWEDIVERIQIEHGDWVLDDIQKDFVKWIKDNKLEDYDDDLIDELVTDRKQDDNEIEEFIDSNGGPTSEAIDRYKDDFRHNYPEEYENRIEDGHEYMDWVREYVKDYMEDEFTQWLIDDIRSNKEVEGKAMQLALEDLTMSDWAQSEWMDGFSGLLYHYDVELEGPDNEEDADELEATKLQMFAVPDSDVKGIFEIETMTNEEDIEIPTTELSTPQEGETALSKAWKYQGEGSLQDMIAEVTEEYRPDNWDEMHEKYYGRPYDDGVNE